jgi:diaminohydroxyphosphoribosylaminopyrimidine deaminase/5-amino-6-(5-phosphoribosylamino)uracil reductase
MGAGHVAPNPLVGCVIVHNERIIGEGFHSEYGQAHAEVNAIKAVKEKHLLPESVLYVNLEPCAHHGKTPPCADLIIEHRIPKVVIGTTDPFHEVSGKGIERLRKAGVEVIVGLLEKECNYLNRRFFTFHRNKRPYTVLKWAQSTDGFLSPPPESNLPKWMTNKASKRLVHKWRSEESAIMVGTETALQDDPELTVRDWSGSNPLRIVLDRQLRIPAGAKLLNGDAPTLVITEKQKKSSAMVRYETIDFSRPLFAQINSLLHAMDVLSLIVEGGQKLIDSCLKEKSWDEARVFIANKQFGSGLYAPDFTLIPGRQQWIGKDQLFIVHNTDAD